MSDEKPQCPHSPTHTHNADGDLIRVCKFCKEPMPVDGVLEREVTPDPVVDEKMTAFLEEEKEDGTS